MEESDHRGDNAATEPRDEHGHFIHQDQPPEPASPASAHPASPVSTHPASPEPAERVVMDALIPRVSIDHKTDDNTLLDVHLGNPLRRIQQLLEEIKAQKAFSFTLKGSLGIAGIALVITTFGIFGGTEAFCSRGTQSEIGTLRMLNAIDSATPPIPFVPAPIVNVWYALTGKSAGSTQRLVLVRQDRTVLHIVKSASVSLTTSYFNSPVIVTGDYDSCTQTLSVKDSHGIQSY